MDVCPDCGGLKTDGRAWCRECYIARWACIDCGKKRKTWYAQRCQKCNTTRLRAHSRDDLIRMVNDGIPVKEIAVTLNLSRQRVYELKRRWEYEKWKSEAAISSY